MRRGKFSGILIFSLHSRILAILIIFGSSVFQLFFRFQKFLPITIIQKYKGMDSNLLMGDNESGVRADFKLLPNERF